jgi:hypothetical protein
MCLLTFVSPGVQPDTAALSIGAAENPDGHGYAVVAGDRIITGHSLFASRAIDQFADVRAAHPDGPALFHSRYATHGVTDKTNCHPFRVGGDSRTVLAHNGVMPKTAQPSKKDTRSDTRIVAETLIPNGMFGSLRSKRGRRRLEKWMGVHNKIVILTVDHRHPERFYILNEEQGIWEGGIWYSNFGYIEWRPKVTLGAWYEDGKEGWKSRKYSETTCFTCFTDDSLDPITRICSFCGVCDDCTEIAQNCSCYVPASLDRITIGSAPLGWPGD